MIALALVLSGCGGDAAQTDSLRTRYQDMDGCVMEARVSCDWAGTPWDALLRCTYLPGEGSVIEVLEPETIAGVKAVLDGETWCLAYEGDCLDAGGVSREEISPAACLPRLMDALREGWPLEENQEDWNGVPCLRLTVDQTGTRAEKVYTTVWIRLDSGIPLRGEISVDGETALTAAFTEFAFYRAEAPSDADAG